MRRFYAGLEQDFDGIRFRIVEGRKPVSAGQDLRVEWLTPEGWIPIPMRVMAFLVAFFCENENVLYPPPRFEGAGKFWKYLHDAHALGRQNAEAGLRMERQFRFGNGVAS